MREIVLWAKAGKQNINHIADIQETIAKQLWAVPTPLSLPLSLITLMFILTFDFDVHLL